MNNQMYCYEQTAQLGSAMYYSLRKLTQAQRDRVVAAHTFYQEIKNIVVECHDHQLALTKFNWWRSEVAKLSLAQPEHPAMLLLQKHLSQPEKVQEKLLVIIDAVEESFLPAPFATFEEVIIYFMRTAGEREKLIDELLGINRIISDEVSAQLMLVIELVHYLQYLRYYIRHDLIYFSQDELTRFQVTEDMLRRAKMTDSIKKLLQYQAEKVERAYLKAQAELTREQRRALSHLLIRVEIAWVTLQEIQQNGFAVLEKLITLTPLRYGWIAWRTS